MSKPEHLSCPLSKSLKEILIVVTESAKRSESPGVISSIDMGGFRILMPDGKDIRVEKVFKDSLTFLEQSGYIKTQMVDNDLIAVTPTELARQRVKYERKKWLGKRWMEFKHNIDQPLSGRWQRISFFLALVVAVIQALELFGITIGGLWKLLLSQIP